ncbi:MAG: META domain-containing protein [Rikenellaceae bacterium]
MKLGIFAVLLLALGCSRESQLTDSQWVFEQIIAQDSLFSVDSPDAKVVLDFSRDGSVIGYGGCNNFFGTYTLEGRDKFKIELSGMTMSMCEFQDFEDIYLRLLVNSSTYTIINNELSLNDTQTLSCLRYKKMD